MGNYLDKEVGVPTLWANVKSLVSTKKDAYVAQATFSNVIASGTSQATSNLYLFSITPDSYDGQYYVKYSLDITMDNETRGTYHGDIELYCSGSSNVTYYISNNHSNTSYLSMYYHAVIPIKSATSITEGYPVYFGIGLRSSYNPTTTSNYRQVTLTVHEVSGGTLEVFDSAKLHSSVYNSTYHSTTVERNGSDNGLVETLDADHFERLQYQQMQKTASGTMYGSQLILSANGVDYFSICTSYSTATTKSCTTNGFRPELMILYGYGTTVASGKQTATYTLYEVISMDVRYSTNLSTITNYAPVFLKATFNRTDGLFYLETSGWATQTLPTSDDGYYYIKIGDARSTTALYIEPKHPIFAYRDGKLLTFGGSGDVETYLMIADLTDGDTQTY